MEVIALRSSFILSSYSLFPVSHSLGAFIADRAAY